MIAEQLAQIDRFNSLEREVHEHEEITSDGSDPELAVLATDELEKLKPRLDELRAEIERTLLLTEPNDDRPAIVEIRAGAGGGEASLFAGDLFRMYARYAEGLGWKAEVLTSSETDGGGFREIIFRVVGPGAYGKLKFEGGVHRVQRVPATESSGRIHTSTATVAVLPEAEEEDLEIQPEDLRIDVFRSGGAGGQSVNTTDSAVRITHLPSGLVVTSQDERSQLKNRGRALKVLRSRLMAEEAERRHNEAGTQRRSLIGSGDRSEKIRTYNFPQDRLTDHRVALSLHGLERILDGELEELFSALSQADMTTKRETAAE